MVAGPPLFVLCTLPLWLNRVGNVRLPDMDLILRRALMHWSSGYYPLECGTMPSCPGVRVRYMDGWSMLMSPGFLFTAFFQHRRILTLAFQVGYSTFLGNVALSDI